MRYGINTKTGKVHRRYESSVHCHRPTAESTPEVTHEEAAKQILGDPFMICGVCFTFIPRELMTIIKELRTQK